MNKNNELYAIKDCITTSVSVNAGVNYCFNEEVNDILNRNGYQKIPNITQKYAAKMADTVCDLIINSKLTMNEKEFILTSINYFINDAAIAERLSLLDFEDRLKEIDSIVSRYRS